MTFPLGGIIKALGPDIWIAAGDFTISGGAIASVRPKLGGVALTRFAAGAYGLQLPYPAASILHSDIEIGPDTGIAGAVPTANPTGLPMISKGFLTYNGGNFAADTTFSKLLILLPNTAGNALIDIPANYRLSYLVVLSETPIN